MEVTKRKIGNKWIVTQRWPRQFQRIDSDFKTEAEADQWITEAEELVATVGVTADWQRANDFAKNIVNKTLGSNL